MKQKRLAFTLLEVLISITLLSLVLMALYKSADILRDSNLHLFHYLEKSSETLKGSKTLYMDLMHSDDNITINTEENFHQVMLGSTTNSLHGLALAQVTWLVHKEDNTLLRIEGGNYHLPLKNEERVEVDVIAVDVEKFEIYKSKKKDKALVVLQTKGQEAQIFMIQSIPLPAPKTNDKTNPNSNNGNNMNGGNNVNGVRTP